MIVIVVLQLVLKMALYNYIRCIYEVAIANEIIKIQQDRFFLGTAAFVKIKFPDLVFWKYQHEVNIQLGDDR